MPEAATLAARGITAEEWLAGKPQIETQSRYAQPGDEAKIQEYNSRIAYDQGQRYLEQKYGSDWYDKLGKVNLDEKISVEIAGETYRVTARDIWAGKANEQFVADYTPVVEKYNTQKKLEAEIRGLGAELKAGDKTLQIISMSDSTPNAARTKAAALYDAGLVDSRTYKKYLKEVDEWEAGLGAVASENQRIEDYNRRVADAMSQPDAKSQWKRALELGLVTEDEYKKATIGFGFFKTQPLSVKQEERIGEAEQRSFEQWLETPQGIRYQNADFTNAYDAYLKAQRGDVERFTKMQEYESQRAGRPIPGPGLGAAPGSIGEQVQKNTSNLLNVLEKPFSDVESTIWSASSKLEAESKTNENPILARVAYEGFKVATFSAGVFTGATLPLRPLKIGETAAGIAIGGAQFLSNPVESTKYAWSQFAANPVKTVVYIGGLAAAPAFLDVTYKGVKSASQRLFDPFGEKAQYAKLQPLESPYQEPNIDYSSNAKFGYHETPIKESPFNPLYKTGTIKLNQVQATPYKFSGKLGFSLESQVFETEKLSQILISPETKVASPLSVSVKSTGSFATTFPVSNIFTAKPFPTRSISQGSAYSESYGAGQGVRVQGYAGLTSKIRSRGEYGLLEAPSFKTLSMQSVSQKSSTLTVQAPQLSYKIATNPMQTQRPIQKSKPIQSTLKTPTPILSTIPIPSLALGLKQPLALSQPQIQLSIQESKTSVSPLSAAVFQPRYTTPLKYEAKKKRESKKPKRRSGRSIYELRFDPLKAPSLKGMRL